MQMLSAPPHGPRLAPRPSQVLHELPGVDFVRVSLANDKVLAALEGALAGGAAERNGPLRGLSVGYHAGASCQVWMAVAATVCVLSFCLSVAVMRTR